MVSAALISIIGPPASGKTTAAEWLAGALPARLILEDYAGNPFLAEACLGRTELALAAQLHFLFSRVSQLNRLTWPGDCPAVSDYGFCQDAIYAAANLSPADLAVYRPLAERAAAVVRPPDAVVHLDGGEGLLLGRIARRGRRFEAAFTPDFIARMRAAYDEAAAGLGCPVIRVDVGRRDLLSQAGRARLLAEVREATK